MPYYQRACALGFPNGCYNEAVLLDGDNRGFPPDYPRAIALYSFACDRGDGLACNNLGRLYTRGRGVAANPARGLALYVRACQLGDVVACANVGNRYRSGWGVTKDFAKAHALLDWACAHREPSACGGKAMMMLAAEGCPRDVEGGLAQLDRNCSEQRDGLSCFWLGEFLRWEPGRPPDAARAASAWEIGCAEANAGSCNSLGKALIKGDGVAASPERGRTLLLDSVRFGAFTNSDQLAVSGTLLLTHFPGDYEIVRVFEASCRDHRERAACTFVEDVHRNGRYGIARDEERANTFAVEAKPDEK